MNTQTGEVTNYIMPGPINMRRSDSDSRPKPAHFWVGANHTAKIVRVEPLE